MTIIYNYWKLYPFPITQNSEFNARVKKYLCILGMTLFFMPLTSWGQDCTPELSCNHLTVTLVGGVVTITPDDVAVSSLCPGNEIELSTINFTCEDVGPNQIWVKLTGNDESRCQSIVTIEQEATPVVECMHELTVELDENGLATVTEEDIVKSKDETCEEVTIVLSQTVFSCDDIFDEEGNPTSINIRTTITDIADANRLVNCNTEITVEDNISPEIKCKEHVSVFLSEADEDGNVVLDPQDFVDSATDNCSIDWDRSNIRNLNSVNCDDAEIEQSVRVRIFDLSGNRSVCDVKLFVDDNVSPTLSCIDSHPHRTFELDGGELTLTVDQLIDGDPNSLYIFSDNCVLEPATLSIAPLSFECPPAGLRDVSITATDGHGQDATCNIQINVIDGTAPTVSCIDPEPDGAGGFNNAIERVLNETTTEITITYEDLIFEDPADPENDVTDFINDNCGVKEITIARVPEDIMVEPEFVDILTFDCEDIGLNDVLIKVIDNSGNEATCETKVRIGDEAPPVVFCNTDFAIPLVYDEETELFFANLNIEDVLFEAEDNCEIKSTEINSLSGTVADDGSTIEFVCEDIQFDEEDNVIPVPVELVVRDINNNEATCITNVTLIDNIDPILECPTEAFLAVHLDEEGTGEITIDMLKDFIRDNDGVMEDHCGIASFEASQETYSCGDLGKHSITVTVKDPSGNAATCDLQIWVQDNTSPVISCIANNESNPLEGFTLSNGELTLTPQDILSSYEDNCGVSNLIISPKVFDCSHIGVKQTVVATAYDAADNKASCTAIILINSANEVSAVCQETATVILDETGIGELTINMVNNGSLGDCETILSFEESGDPVETLAYDCEDIRIEFEEDDEGNPIIPFVTLYVTDRAGNQESCTTNIFVKDITAPIAKCRENDFELRLIHGSALLEATYINAGSTDECGGPLDLSITPTSFDCSHVGLPQEVILTVTDESGNSSECTGRVNIVNNQAPEVTCQESDELNPIEIAIGADGTRTLVIADLLADNYVPCGTDIIYTIEVEGREDALFTCEDIARERIILDEDGEPLDPQPGGPYKVTLTATANGLSTDCIAYILLVDDLDPIIECADAVTTLALDAWGKVEVTEENLAFEATDNCEVVETTFSPDLFLCDAVEEGEIEVVVTVKDESGNEATCIRKVVIKDGIAPTITCPHTEDVLLEPEADCQAAFAWDLPVYEDKCGIKDFRVETVPDVELTEEDGVVSGVFKGVTVITYGVEDPSGNVNTCTFRILVEDKHAPTFINCPTDVTVATAADECVGYAQFANFSSNDNCGIVEEICVYKFPDESLLTSPPAPTPSSFPIGTTFVSHRVKDAAGNEALCEYSITVVDEIAPTLVFNNYSVLNPLFGFNDGDEVILPHGTEITYSELDVTVEDNCDVNVTFEDSAIPINCTDDGYEKAFLCVWTATDAAGNSTTLSLTIKVECPLATAPNLFVNRGRFFSNFVKDQEKSFTVILEEKNGSPTVGPIEFLITTTDGFSYTFPPSHATANNSDWEATAIPASNLIKFKCKSGVVIPANGIHEILIHVKALIPGAAANTTTRLFPSSGGDSDGTDNTNIIDFSIQN